MLSVVAQLAALLLYYAVDILFCWVKRRLRHRWFHPSIESETNLNLKLTLGHDSVDLDSLFYRRPAQHPCQPNHMSHQHRFQLGKLSVVMHSASLAIDGADTLLLNDLLLPIKNFKSLLQSSISKTAVLDYPGTGASDRVLPDAPFSLNTTQLIRGDESLVWTFLHLDAVVRTLLHQPNLTRVVGVGYGAYLISFLLGYIDEEVKRNAILSRIIVPAELRFRLRSQLTKVVLYDPGYPYQDQWFDFEYHVSQLVTVNSTRILSYLPSKAFEVVRSWLRLEFGPFTLGNQIRLGSGSTLRRWIQLQHQLEYTYIPFQRDLFFQYLAHWIGYSDGSIKIDDEKSRFGMLLQQVHLLKNLRSSDTGPLKRDKDEDKPLFSVNSFSSWWIPAPSTEVTQMESVQQVETRVGEEVALFSAPISADANLKTNQPTMPSTIICISSSDPSQLAAWWHDRLVHLLNKDSDSPQPSIVNMLDCRPMKSLPLQSVSSTPNTGRASTVNDWDQFGVVYGLTSLKPILASTLAQK